VKALYDKPPSAAELAEFGVRQEDFPPVIYTVWDENWPAFEMYLRYRTQWIQGPGGPTGLNYVPLSADLDRRGIYGEARESLIDGIRVIEDAVLAQVYKDR